MHGWAFALLLSVLAPEREKRDSQAIIDTLRDTLEERNATVESLQNALDKTEMLCSTLKVSPPGQWGGIATILCLEYTVIYLFLPPQVQRLKVCTTMPSLGSQL